ncbi:MAG: NAD(P)-dependent alcohol dehydrogenase [Acidimicrobiales bacterium]
MRAIVQDRYGPADVLELRTVDRPGLADTEVLVEVHAAGLDRGVWHLMTGTPYLLRLLGFGLTAPKQPVLGADVAGRVVAVGEDVTRFRPGDEVFGIARGSFADYAVADEAKLAPKPAGLTDEQAAVATLSGITALQALTDVGRLEPSQRVLVLGASGGVGTYAVQLATALGGHVTGVCSTAKVDAVRALGADDVVDYTAEDALDGRTRYDLIVDIGGCNRLRRLRRALTANGTLVIVGGEGGGRWTGGIGRQLRAMLLSPFVGQRLTAFISKERTEVIERLAEHLERGDVTPVVGATYDLAAAPDALRDLEGGRVTGKAAIRVR